ncbi:MAG: phosphate signaling complex protein PhoU [Acidobacteriota bacterium]
MLKQEAGKLKGQLIYYAGLVESMIDKSITGLLNKDHKLLNEVAEKDEPRANDYEIEIEEACTVIIAKFQPAAKDLRMIMMIAQINNDLERMADQAVNIVESALFLIDRPQLKPLIDIPHMAKICKKMVKNAIDSFINEDVKLAAKICKQDDIVDDIQEQIYRELITYIIDNPKTIERALHLNRISNNLERIADLSTNICEDVIFIVEGRMIKHHKDEEA